MPINPLIAETPEEQTIFRRAEGITFEISPDIEYNRTKKLTAKNSLSQRPPTLEEAELIHNMYLEQREYSNLHISISHSSVRFKDYKTQGCHLHVRHSYREHAHYATRGISIIPFSNFRIEIDIQ